MIEAEKTARGDWKKEERAMVLEAVNAKPIGKRRCYIIQQGKLIRMCSETGWGANDMSEMAKVFCCRGKTNRDGLGPIRASTQIGLR
jgi:hypothetical protein